MKHWHCQAKYSYVCNMIISLSSLNINCNFWRETERNIRNEREKERVCMKKYERCSRVCCALAGMKFLLLYRKFLGCPSDDRELWSPSWVQAHVILLCDKDELVRRYPAEQQQQQPWQQNESWMIIKRIRTARYSLFGHLM